MRSWKCFASVLVVLPVVLSAYELPSEVDRFDLSKDDVASMFKAEFHSKDRDEKVVNLAKDVRKELAKRVLDFSSKSKLMVSNENDNNKVDFHFHENEKGTIKVFLVRVTPTKNIVQRMSIDQESLGEMLKTTFAFREAILKNGRTSNEARAAETKLVEARTFVERDVLRGADNYFPVGDSKDSFVNRETDWRTTRFTVTRQGTINFVVSLVGFKPEETVFRFWAVVPAPDETFGRGFLVEMGRGEPRDLD